MPTKRTTLTDYATLAALFLLLITVLACAPGGPGAAPGRGRNRPAPPPERPADPDQYLQLLTKRLHLTPDQADAARPVLERQLAGEKELTGQTAGLDPRERAERLGPAMLRLRADTARDLKPILSPAQMDALERLWEQMDQPDRSVGRPGGRGRF